MTRWSHIPFLLTVQLTAMFLMLSCGAGSTPQQMTVHVPAGYSGKIHIDSCVKTAPPSDVMVDANGAGATALCPANGQRVEILVIRGEQSVKVPATEVTILRTGDGIATSIEVQVRP